MACCGPKCSKAFVIFFNILFWFSGCALVALGVILLYDQLYTHLFTLLTGDQLPPAVLQYVALGCIALGGVILFVGFFGCCGALQDSKCMLGTYLFFLILIFLIEAFAGLIALYGYFYYPLSTRQTVVTKQLQNYGVVASMLDYEHQQQHNTNQQFTDALDFVQFEFECCGIDNKSDWLHSKWKSDQLGKRTQQQYGQQKSGGKDVQVPSTCCTVDKLEWIDSDEPWKNPKPKNFEHCQGTTPVDSSGYVHDRGCWEQAMQWYYRQNCCLTPTIGGLALLQIIGIIFTICLIRNLNGDEGV